MPTRSPRPRTRPVGALAAMLAFAVVAGVIVAVAVTPAVAVAGTTANAGIGLFESLPSDLKIAPLDQKTRIYAKDGKDGKEVQIAAFYAQNRDVIGWSDLSSVVKNATVAGEDVRFYQHGAVDPVGMVRAAVADALHQPLQGASTITQQYVKNVCVQEAENQATKKAVDAAYNDCTDTTLVRKLQEARYAIALQKKYSKNQILLAYLNIAGFGGQVYGIESAARYYYDTTAKDLSIAQAASLVAIVNNPQYLRLDIAGNLAANTERRNYILQVERTHGLITDAQYATAVATKEQPKIHATTQGCGQAPDNAGFFCQYVVNTILRDPHFGKTYQDRYDNLQTAGWRIYTTLDLKAQAAAQQAEDASIPKTASFAIGGSDVSLEVGTGRILDMAENKDFTGSGGSATSTGVNFNGNLALGDSDGIQPGSTYKLFTLIQWLENGHTLGDVVNGDSRTIPASDFTACGSTYEGDPWPVHNDSSVYDGNTTVLRATAYSINGAFASMAEQLDLCKIQDTAESLGVYPASGVTDPRIFAPFVIGGSYGVSPVSMAGAYAAIANNGVYCAPIAIDSVVTRSGAQVAVPSADCHQVVPTQVAIAVEYALRTVFQYGTAGGDDTADGLYEFGKTGTTDNGVQTWTDGTTSKVTTVVWVGNNGTQQSLFDVDLGYCAAGFGSGASVQRHCVWKATQSALNAEYGGATSWAQPEAQYLSGGTESLSGDAGAGGTTGAGAGPGGATGDGSTTDGTAPTPTTTTAPGASPGSSTPATPAPGASASVPATAATPAG